MKFRNIMVAVGLGAISFAVGHQYATDTYEPLFEDALKEVNAHEVIISTLNTELNSLEGERNSLRHFINAAVSRPVEVHNTSLVFNKESNVGKFVISAYSPYDDRNGLNSDGNPNETATGTKPGPGTFAVDPNIIPYGSNITIVYPDGKVEHGVAEDTGGAIKNNRIDVFRWTFEGAMDFGMKEAIVIWE